MATHEFGLDYSKGQDPMSLGRPSPYNIKIMPDGQFQTAGMGTDDKGRPYYDMSWSMRNQSYQYPFAMSLTANDLTDPARQTAESVLDRVRGYDPMTGLYADGGDFESAGHGPQSVEHGTRASAAGRHVDEGTWTDQVEGTNDWMPLPGRPDGRQLPRMPNDPYTPRWQANENPTGTSSDTWGTNPNMGPRPAPPQAPTSFDVAPEAMGMQRADSMGRDVPDQYGRTLPDVAGPDVNVTDAPQPSRFSPGAVTGWGQPDPAAGMPPPERGYRGPQMAPPPMRPPGPQPMLPPEQNPMSTDRAMPPQMQPPLPGRGPQRPTPPQLVRDIGGGSVPNNSLAGGIDQAPDWIAEAFGDEGAGVAFEGLDLNSLFDGWGF